jgi:hypothetical protein
MMAAIITTTIAMPAYNPALKMPCIALQLLNSIIKAIKAGKTAFFITIQFFRNNKAAANKLQRLCQ